MYWERECSSRGTCPGLLCAAAALYVNPSICYWQSATCSLSKHTVTHLIWRMLNAV